MTREDTYMVHPIPEQGLGVKQPSARVLDSQATATKYDPTRHRSIQDSVVDSNAKTRSSETKLPERTSE